MNSWVMRMEALSLSCFNVPKGKIMNDKAIIKKLFNYIRKKNKSRNLWIIYWISGLILLVLMGCNAKILDESYLSLLDVSAAVVLLALGTQILIRKYTVMARSNTEIFGIFIISVFLVKKMSDYYERITDISKSHGINNGIYYGFILVRILIVQGISSLAILMAGLLKIIDMKAACFYIGMVIVIPLLVWTGSMLAANISSKYKKGIVSEIITRLIVYFELLIAFLSLMIFCVSFGTYSGMIARYINLKRTLDFSKDLKIVFVDDSVSLITLFAIMAILLIMDVHDLIIKSEKLKIIFYVCIMAFMMLPCILTIVGNKNEYVCFSEDSVSVKHDTDERVYEYKQIDNYKFYYSGERLWSDLTFDDSLKEIMSTENSVESLSWKEKYDNDETYFYQLANKLNALGAEGETEDRIAGKANG